MFERYYFIIAPNFHGATLLSKLLNDHPQIVSLGDTYPSNQFDQICGCGEYVSRCRFWKQVSNDLGIDRGITDQPWLPNYPRIVDGRKDRLLYNILPVQLLMKMISTSERNAFSADFVNFTRSVHEHNGRPEARIYVDGVKSISRVFALAAGGVQIDGVIHLRRNPGDYIQSSMKQNGYSYRSFVQGLLNYRLFHNRARRVGRNFSYFSLTYEGLAEAPEATLDRLFRFLDVEPLSLPELMAEARVQPWHFMGNASLFQFDGTVRASRHRQTRTERAVTRALAGSFDGRACHLTERVA